MYRDKLQVLRSYGRQLTIASNIIFVLQCHGDGGCLQLSSTVWQIFKAHYKMYCSDLGLHHYRLSLPSASLACPLGPLVSFLPPWPVSLASLSGWPLVSGWLPWPSGFPRPPYVSQTTPLTVATEGHPLVGTNITHMPSCTASVAEAGNWFPGDSLPVITTDTSANRDSSPCYARPLSPPPEVVHLVITPR